VLGDYGDPSLTVFGRPATVNWKPVLLISRQVIRLFAYLVAHRDNEGNWTLSIRSYASEEGLQQVKARLIVRRPFLDKEAKLAETITSVTPPVVTYSMTVNILSSKLSESEVLASSNCMRLTDAQVRGLTVDRTLLEYSVEILPRV